MYCAFRLNPEYDAELIEYLRHKKNKSRAIRELIRVSYGKTTSLLAVKQPEEPQIIVEEIVKQQEQ